jgi:hypothetical protein
MNLNTVTRTGKIARWLSLRCASAAIRALDAEDIDPNAHF